MRTPNDRDAAATFAEKVDGAFDELSRTLRRVARLYYAAALLNSERALQIRRDFQNELTSIDNELSPNTSSDWGRPSREESATQTRGPDSRSSQINEEICNFLHELNRNATIDEIHQHLTEVELSEARDSLMTRVSRLVGQGKLVRPVRGYYGLPRHGAGER